MLHVLHVLDFYVTNTTLTFAMNKLIMYTVRIGLCEDHEGLLDLILDNRPRLTMAIYFSYQTTNLHFHLKAPHGKNNTYRNRVDIAITNVQY